MTLWILIALLFIIIVIPIGLFIILYIYDRVQKRHSILRNYPIVGKFRYVIEKIGPELRQYLFHNDTEARPFHRKEFEFVYKAAKYNSREIGYGAERDFRDDGFYLVNDMFPLQKSELKIISEPKVKSYVYDVTSDNLFSRSERYKETKLEPAYLHPDYYVTLGKETSRQPFVLKGMIGQSAMSFGALGNHAITALSEGLGMAGATWMNTGEGGLSKYHLKGNVDLIMQISPGLFGVRTKDGDFSWEEFEEKNNIEQIKAYELKLAQGAKQRGGHVAGKKINEEIAEVRKVEPWQDIDSPNHFPGINTPEELLNFLQKLRETGGKPVGIKLVVGNEKNIEKVVSTIAKTGIIPDFITIDGGEGGTGASYYELAYSVGLPSFAAIPMVDDYLKKYNIRSKTKIIASGKLLTPDKIAIALSLGADLVNIARGFMLSVGCIMAQKCHTNTCPTGVTTTDSKLQKALVIEEKKYRVCNYLLALRQALFELTAVAGLSSPTEFTREHVVYHSYFKQFGKSQSPTKEDLM